MLFHRTNFSEFVFLAHNWLRQSQCPAQDLRLNLVYSVSLLVSYAFTAVQGFILDWRGPRLTFTIGVLLYTIGAVSYVLTGPKSPIDGIFLGQVLVSTGAPPIFTALMFFAALIPSKMPTVSLNTPHLRITFTLWYS
jgi:hypothetical protein